MVETTIPQSLGYPAFTVCSNAGVPLNETDFKAVNCTLSTLVKGNYSGCNPFKSYDCLAGAKFVESPCGRFCIQFFSDIEYSARYAADFIRLSLHIGDYSAPDVPYRGAFAYVHSVGENPFDVLDTNNDWILIKSGYYHLLGIEKSQTTTQDGNTSTLFTSDIQSAPLVTNFSKNGKDDEQTANVVIDISYNSFKVQEMWIENKVDLTSLASDMAGIYQTTILKFILNN